MYNGNIITNEFNAYDDAFLWGRIVFLVSYSCITAIHSCLTAFWAGIRRALAALTRPGSPSIFLYVAAPPSESRKRRRLPALRTLLFFDQERVGWQTNSYWFSTASNLTKSMLLIIKKKQTKHRCRFSSAF